jgi:hypothetical protein
VRGRVIVEDGQVVDAVPTGRHLPAKPLVFGKRHDG